MRGTNERLEDSLRNLHCATRPSSKPDPSAAPCPEPDPPQRRVVAQASGCRGDTDTPCRQRAGVCLLVAEGVNAGVGAGCAGGETGEDAHRQPHRPGLATEARSRQDDAARCRALHQQHSH
ncbi:unnamed protein product [Pleuronectes platessa]|uniref:Uncharacterized protein n=1 Tax=Pleuronectes platessa TaxID=8262 RepID=A0A9N7V1L8_PLEPL|nr:unnamed protein product [Pleuronectes platessa]